MPGSINSGLRPTPSGKGDGRRAKGFETVVSMSRKKISMLIRVAITYGTSAVGARFEVKMKIAEKMESIKAQYSSEPSCPP